MRMLIPQSWLQNQSLEGPLAGFPKLPNRDTSRAPLVQSGELGPRRRRRARPGWKEFMCRRHDKNRASGFLEPAGLQCQPSQTGW